MKPHRFGRVQEKPKVLGKPPAKQGKDILLLHEENAETETPFVLAHFELRGNKIGLMKNETDADFGDTLVREGIRRDQIVLGFLSPNARKDSGYATE